MIIQLAKMNRWKKTFFAFRHIFAYHSTIKEQKCKNDAFWKKRAQWEVSRLSGDGPV